MLLRFDIHPYTLGRFLGINHASARLVGSDRVWKRTSQRELEILHTLHVEEALLTPTLLETYMIGTEYFMIQQYCPYKTLHELCSSSTTFPLSKQQWSTLYATCYHLYVDFEIDHGDLIPSNILFSDDDRFYLIDFERAAPGEGDYELLDSAMATLKKTMVSLVEE